MEAGDASSGNRGKRSLLNLPPGYHFAPTDEELIVYYLRRKIDGLAPLLPIFRDADVVGCPPDKITANAEEFRDCGEERWYFFTKRFRKYKKGSRPNRSTPDIGFWKATGPQRKIYTRKKEKRLVGRVRTLVYYNAPKETDQVPKGTGKADKKKAQAEGKTSWTMYEYENLTSEAEAADPNIDKIGEWVLCTIQTQKKDESKVKETKRKGKITEGSSAGEKKVKESKGKGKIKAGSKKRKGEQEKMVAENGTDQDPIQALHLMKRSKLPMHPETFAPEEGDEMGMFDSEYNSFPRKSSPVPRVQQHQHESPRSEIMSPCITDNNYYGPNMAPTPCLQEPSHSEMTSTSVGGNYYNIGSAGPDMMWSMPWRATPLLEMMPLAFLAGNSYGFNPQEAPHMKMEYQTPSSLLGCRNIDPRMATHQPATGYSYPPLAFGYGGAAQNAGSHYGYAGGDLGSFLSSSSSSGFNFGESSQYHGGPSVPGAGRAVTPAAALQWRDQVTART
ncbi:unnamed protein product [Alopecurus aequalis]